MNSTIEKKSTAANHRKIIVCDNGCVHVQHGSVTVHFSKSDFVEFIQAAIEVCHELHSQSKPLQ